MELVLHRDFSEEELSYLNTLSNEELERLVSRCANEEAKQSTNQLVKKTLINGVYGALGNVHCRYFSLQNAEAVTSYGQLAIQWVARKLNEYMNNIVGTSGIDYVVYCDTDSVVGDTVIEINGTKTTIADFYDSVGDDFVRKDNIRQDYVKKVTNCVSPSVNLSTHEVEYNNVAYVMKHRVQKVMWKITTLDNKDSVIVTKDHSVMVMRDGEIIDVEPSEMEVFDSVIHKDDWTTEYRLECLGVQEIDVYDIEVEHNHNFFANNILVHNSTYIAFDKVIDKIGEDKFRDTNHVVDFLNKLATERLEPFIDESYKELEAYMNNQDHLMLMDREAIACAPLGSKGLCSFWTAKKRYALNVYDMEGTRYAEPKLKIMGLETRRSSTPAAMQSALEDCIRLMVQEGEEALQEYVSTFRARFDKMDYREVAKVSTANGIQVWSQNGYPIPKCPAHIRGALCFNRNFTHLEGVDPISEGEKVMILPLVERNPYNEVWISWSSGTKLPDETILRFVDWNTLFQGTFIKPLTAMTEAAGIDYEHRASLADIFDI